MKPIPKLYPVADSPIMQDLIADFWHSGGKQQFINIVMENPDKDMSLWLKAHLMDIIDNAKITFE